MALSLGQKAGWGLADMGIVVFVVVKQLLILTFLTSYLGVPVGIAGFVTTAVLIFDMITDPLIGYLSDRTNSRFGRRAPWMFIGALVMVAGMVGLFSVPAGLSMSGNLAWVIAGFVLATIGFTMVAIPFGAQAGEITQDPRERSAMTGWRMGFASIGILIGGALIPGLAGSMGYAMAALAVSPLIVGAFSAIWLFGQKLANAAAPAVLGLILARAGWQETTEGVVVQMPEALSALQTSITLVPAGILVVALMGLIAVYLPMQRRALA